MQPLEFGDDTLTGALCRHVSTDYGDYDPMNSSFGILAPLREKIRDKSERKIAYAERAIESMKKTVNQ